MKGTTQRPDRSASQGRKRSTKRNSFLEFQRALINFSTLLTNNTVASTLIPMTPNKQAVTTENIKNKILSQTVIRSPALQQGKAKPILSLSQINNDASLLKSPSKPIDSSLNKSSQSHPHEGNLNGLPTEENGLNTSRDVDTSVGLVRPLTDNREERPNEVTNAAISRKDSLGTSILEIKSKPVSNLKPLEAPIQAKFKKTVKEATTLSATTATNIEEEEGHTSRRCKRIKTSLRATSESVNHRSQLDSAIPRQLAPIKIDPSKNQVAKTLTQIVTPRESSVNTLKKSYHQIKKESNSLTMPHVLMRKERVVMTRNGEEKREKLIMKDKLPNFNLRVERPPTSLPSTNTNKTAKSETPLEKKNIFAARSPPSKLLINNKAPTIGQLRIVKPSPIETGNKFQTASNAGRNLLTSASSESMQNNRNLANLNIRTKSPNIQGVETPLSGKRLKTELGPEERERRRLQYVAPTASNKYKYYVGEGNNGELVKRVLNAREQWEEIESFNSLFNLKWQQNYNGYKYERLTGQQNPKQLVNHFEFHKEISTKNGLIKNLTNYCAQNKIELFNHTPITFAFDMDDDVRFESDLITFSHFFRKNCGDPKAFCQNEFAQAKRTPANAFFTFDFKKKGGIYHIPETLTNEKREPSCLRPKLFNTYFKGSNLWLLKPTGLNRGMGIEIFNTLSGLNKYLNEYLDGEAMTTRRKTNNEVGSDSDSGEEEKNTATKKKKGPPNANIRSRTFVIQKYIESPLLVFNRKFDIRAYAIVTHEMKLYFFRDGYLRTSSEEFTIGRSDIDNKFIHLTNDAVQKYSDSYGVCEQANKLSYKEFQAYMDKNGIPLSLEKQLIPRMRELVEISMNSVGRLLNPNQRKHCFEVFGYDFIIDSELNVFLIEVNTNPCLEESGPILSKLIPRMIHINLIVHADDAFKLTVDVLFPLKYEKPAKLKMDKENVVNPESASDTTTIASTKEEISSPMKDLKARMNTEFKLEDYNDDQNLWDFVCTLDTSKGFPRRAR